MGKYLGLDSSTQSLTAILIDTDRGEVLVDRSLRFGHDLPEYGSPSGFLPDPDPTVRHADPLMWVAALDRLLGDLRDAGVDLGGVRAVSGAGQQHGSVYLAHRIDDVGGWSDDRPLCDQVRPLLSRKTSPIWMDSSTTRECEEIARAAGGSDRVLAISGSRCIERFTAAQIRKYCREDPAGYERTAEIHLVSSFMASLLVGASAPIDLGDGAGMNLLDLAAGQYSPLLLEATAPGLGAKLVRPVPSRQQVGVVSSYFVKRYGFAAGTPVFAFTGDNPSSLVGMGASSPGTAVVSLGTSDTVFAAMEEPRTDPRGYGHVFGNPAGGFMSLICFANGSLAREEVATRFGLGWDDFARAIAATPPGNSGNLMLPYFVPEMTPKLIVPSLRLLGSSDFVAWRDGPAAARAIVEAQALSMRLHSDWIGRRPETILATGGASRNRAILQVLADVLGAVLRPLRVANSSALGAALRAAQAAEGVPFDALAARFSAPDPDLVVKPNPEARSAYQALGAAFEARLGELLAR
jgi:xylulokinase